MGCTAADLQSNTSKVGSEVLQLSGARLGSRVGEDAADGRTRSYRRGSVPRVCVGVRIRVTLGVRVRFRVKDRVRARARAWVRVRVGTGAVRYRPRVRTLVAASSSPG